MANIKDQRRFTAMRTDLIISFHDATARIDDILSFLPHQDDYFRPQMEKVLRIALAAPGVDVVKAVATLVTTTPDASERCCLARYACLIASAIQLADELVEWRNSPSYTELGF